MIGQNFTHWDIWEILIQKKFWHFKVHLHEAPFSSLKVSYTPRYTQS
jgi:hypothetical protein